MKKLALVLLFLIVGCATKLPAPDPRVEEYKQYIKANKPLAKIGKIKWSEYYAGVYSRAIDLNSPDVAASANELQREAHRYEEGAISQEDFLYIQQSETTKQIARNQQREQATLAEQSARTLLALQIMQANQYKPAQLTVTPLAPSPQPNSSYQSSVVTNPVPVSVSAFWTGQQRQVQTITNQIGWSCAYSYAGRNFWRTFVSSCPSSVQVQ